MAWWFRRHRELAAGIALGIVLGLIVIALFVFVFSEQAVDEPQIDQSPPSTSPKTTP
jgi:Mg/Co/Ni transporter MgtE